MELKTTVVGNSDKTNNVAGVDLKFVKAGLSCLESGGSLFSLHKSSTREYIIKTGQRWESTQVFQFDY